MSMQYHAACEECNRMECNENVENASECKQMHKNAYGKNQHHFREKTTTIPSWIPWGSDLARALMIACGVNHRRKSYAISGNQSPSEPIRANPHQSAEPPRPPGEGKARNKLGIGSADAHADDDDAGACSSGGV